MHASRVRAARCSSHFRFYKCSSSYHPYTRPHYKYLGQMSVEASASIEEMSTTKKLRSGWEPDLKIWVGAEDDKKVFHHHSLFLATYSDYIDAMLANPMAERKSRELTFPDIQPDVWEKMLGFLEDPLEGRRMTVADALLVFPFYEKYQFPKGIKLCDKLFHEFATSFTATSFTGSIPFASLDTLIDVAVMADRVGAGIAKEVCVKHLEGILPSSWLTENQFNKLIHLIAKEQMLLGAVGMTEEEVRNPFFSRLWQARRQLLHDVPVLQLILDGGAFCFDTSCTRVSADCYVGPETGRISRLSQICVERDDAANWTVYNIVKNGGVELERTTLWVCPQSKNVYLPPVEGWEIVDDTAPVGNDRLVERLVVRYETL